MEKSLQSSHTRLWLAFLLLLSVGVGGCAHTATYSAASIEEVRRPAAQRAEGKVLVHTSRADDEYIFTGNPTSFTGAATTLTLPIGMITREAAKAAFADNFKDGAEAANELAGRPGPVLIVSPKVTAFSYEYNQLKNVGLAITPTVRVTLRMQVLDSGGKVAWERSYESGAVEGGSWLVNLSPAESMGKLTAKAIYELLARSAGEIAKEAPPPK